MLGENKTVAFTDLPGTMIKPSEKSVPGAVAPSSAPSHGFDFVTVKAEPPLLVILIVIVWVVTPPKEGANGTSTEHPAPGSAQSWIVA